MMSSTRYLCVAPFLTSVWLSSYLAAAPARYVARLQSGAIIEGNTLSEWHTAEAAPKLENQPLLDPANPFRWLVDRAVPPPSPPESFVEFMTGDRLPGQVVDFRPADETPYAPTPAHFLVEYAGTNVANLEPQRTVIAVEARWVRRIVWQSRSDAAYEPRTAFFHEGNFVHFRSIRFSRGEAILLLEKGVRRVPYTELAELHLPPTDFWQLYFDEMGELAPDGQRRLLQLETTSGLIATTSLDRYLPRVVGDARDVNRWIHGLQPAWSLDVLWVPQGTVWMRRSFAPHEIPLSRVPVKRFEQRSTLGSVNFPLGLNRSLAGGPLRSGNREAGWGLAVHAFAEVEYELPPATRSFRSEFSLDAHMADGGCVLPRVLNAAAGNAPLYQGPIVVGSVSVLDTGVLGLSGPADAPRRIVLQVDPVLTNRPAGADPFDIRDHANWLDPLVDLDPTLVKQQIDARAAPSLLPWRGWEVALESGAQTKWVNFFAEAPGNRGEYHSAVGVTGNALALRMNRALAAEEHWLVIDAVRTLPPGPPTKLAVRIGGGMPAEYDLPVYDKARSDFRPIVLPLTEPRTGPTMIEIRQLPTPDSSPVLWRSLAIVSQHPMLERLFEDQSGPSNLKGGEKPPRTVAVVLDDQQKHFGTRSARFDAAQPLNLSVGRRVAIRERPQLGEFRFLRFAVRKQGGGGLRVTLQQPSTAERAARYEAGANPPADLDVKRLNNEPLREDWLVITRDLYADFGNLDLEGLTFEMSDGERAWIDHVYLARTQSDFELVKSLPAP